MSVWNKVDSSLASIYLDFLHEKEHGVAAVPRHHPFVPKEGRLNVSLHYAGDLADIEAAGFKTTSRSTPGRASGDVDLGNLEQITAHPGVVRISYGSASRPVLDVSVPDVNVRGAGKIWTVANGIFSGTTGAQAIIGIIDSGIDFRHPFFRDLANTTRILRIWDQGLLPGGAGQSSPPAARLEDPAGPTYGVEYDEDQINKTVQKVEDIVKSRDCNGHGTHVASIAAGNGYDKDQYVGVAPHAKLIIVKHLFLDNDPPVNWKQVFRDAVCYILNTADSLGKPVVINMSINVPMSSHDGITDGEDFLTHKFAGATGKACVVAAGNDAGSNVHARLEFPPGGGTVDIPLTLTDTRANKIEYNNCRPKNETSSVTVNVYYPDGKTLNGSVRLPDAAAFHAGPVLDAADESDVFSGRRWKLRNVTEEVSLTGGGTFKRRLFQLEQIPNAALEHYQGSYVLRLTTTDEMTAHLYCDQGRGDFMVDSSSALPAIVHLEDRFLIASYGGADNVITVAAYNAEGGSTRPVAYFSSRGPIATYGGPAPPVKPDIAAPGMAIDGAMSDDAQRTTCKPNTQQLQGTSMAAPHVTGAVALLLTRNTGLTNAEIISLLKTHPRTDPPLVAEEVGVGRLDAKAALDAAPP